MNMIFFSFLLLTFLSNLVICQQMIIPTEYGPVRGLTEGGIRVWRGVPYAAPPVGNLRFRPPVPPKPWSGPLPCFSSSKICAQVKSVDGYLVGDEDCLYLDIYSPANATSSSKLPVMYWIYGGGFVFGDKYELGLYDAINLVGAHNYVHVAVNYRLSALGFLSVPGLFKESGTSGNYAMQDQQLGLNFVKNNILAFGGDPNSVTIFGESAGAFSVCWHLVSPLSKGLFHAAILESTNCQTPCFYYDLDDAFSYGEAYSGLVGCNSNLLSDDGLVDCLRNLTLAQLIGANVGIERRMKLQSESSSFFPLLYPVMPWGPTIDKTKKGLMNAPYYSIQSGNYNKVPVILGTNENEGNIFVPAISLIVPGASFPLNEDRTMLVLEHFFNSSVASTAMSLYKYSALTYEGVASNIIRDFFFTCEARRLVNALSKYQDTYLYIFTFESPNWVDEWILGDYHSSELEYVFNNPWPPLIHYFDTDDQIMANTFGSYWTTFAATKSPNGINNKDKFNSKGYMNWAKYNSSVKAYMEMNVPTQTLYNLDYNCEFWDTVKTNYNNKK